MPIEDPRYAAKRRERLLDEQADAAAAARLEYIKPIVMLVGGVAVVMGMSVTAGGREALLYPIVLAIELVFGVLGLYVATKLWLGGVGPLGLAILRLAGIYAVTDVVSLLTQPLLIVGWLITAAVYVGLLAWLFELEVMESVILALITFLLKLIAGFVLVASIIAS